ncbi:cysteine desulfurase family protein [Uliginosibacterium sp. sgz301328]|uniref:cysteine desulfurase family protein n=1 Tax=Uliginosibacterium sp. sgz301328 TaxID=3243764 RepID=UPI00359E6609
MFAPAYFDANATTPLDARVLDAMLPYLGARFGNASSRHEYGRQARAAIDTARQQVAVAVGAHPTELVFTSGGSEANNLFIKGAAASRKPGVMAIGATEHPCVRLPALHVQQHGWRVVQLMPDADGQVNVDAAVALIVQDRPAVVSVMLANNETGAINDIAPIAAATRQAGGWFHTDAVQALGKMPVDFRGLGVHAMTLSSHKIYGPIGAGALVMDKRVDVPALIAGGGQERGLRAGTENLAAIVGFGVAAELAVAEMSERTARQRAARDVFENGLGAIGAQVFGAAADRLPNTSFFAFEHIDGETLVAKLDRAGFAVASGSACSSADAEPSRTLLAMGVEPGLARGAVRVSMPHDVELNDVDRLLRALKQTVDELKHLAAVAI